MVSRFSRAIRSISKKFVRKVAIKVAKPVVRISRSISRATAPKQNVRVTKTSPKIQAVPKPRAPPKSVPKTTVNIFRVRQAPSRRTSPVKGASFIQQPVQFSSVPQNQDINVPQTQRIGRIRRGSFNSIQSQFGIGTVGERRAIRGGRRVGASGGLRGRILGRDEAR